MTDDELNIRIELLETRLMYQESALEELTRTLLGQEQLIREQAETIKRVTAQCRALLPAPLGPPADETPPHY
jgi:uncharacterized coiled-coil protein SlyX